MTLDQLFRDRPAIHAGADDPAVQSLTIEALSFTEKTMTAGSRTLETGSGYSTIMFAAAGAEHLCVVPSAREEGLIREYCQHVGIDTARLSFKIASSERVLPTLDLGELDLVLIDGSHNFPQVFIDWFYTADALKVGGLVLIDDIHLWTCRLLRDVLESEPRWELADELGGRTAVMRKVASLDHDRQRTDQPYVVRRTSKGSRERVRKARSMIRHGHLDACGRGWAEQRDVAAELRPPVRGNARGGRR